MFCTKCGEEIEKGNLFCTKCGAKAEEEINEKREHQIKKSKNKKTRNMIIIILLIILIIVLIWGISNIKEDKIIETKQNVEDITSSENNNLYNEYLAVIREYENKIENEDVQYLDLKYALCDINNDKMQELIIFSGTCNADTEYIFYTYKDNKVVKLGSNYGDNSILYKVKDNNYLKQIRQVMGYITILNIEYNGDKLEIYEVNTIEDTQLNEQETEEIYDVQDETINFYDTRSLKGLDVLKN